MSDQPLSRYLCVPRYLQSYTSELLIPAELVPSFDPVYLEYYNKYNAGRLATHQVPIEAFRTNPAKYAIAYGRARVSADGLAITDRKCPVKGGEITVRTFKRDSSAETRLQPKPAYVNFHGGGWVFGGLETDFDFCKRLVHNLDCVAFDVDYRLAPEYPYPTPVEDCIAAFRRIRETLRDEFNIDLSRIAVGGCSAGGHLSAVIAHVCRNESIPLALQVLAVPVVDLHVFTPEGELRPDSPYASHRDLAYTRPLPLERMSWFHKAFLGNPRPAELDNDWKVSPILAPDFKNLAPALVLIAGMDPLRDEGEAYAAKMREAGCQVDILRFEGAPHTFMQLDGILESGKKYNETVVAALQKTFGL